LKIRGDSFTTSASGGEYKGAVAREGIEPPTRVTPSFGIFYRVEGITKGIKIIKM
jgi:hypothetical protein